MPFLVRLADLREKVCEALAQDCGAYAMKYGRIWFPVVHGSRKCMDYRRENMREAVSRWRGFSEDEIGAILQGSCKTGLAARTTVITV